MSEPKFTKGTWQIGFADGSGKEAIYSSGAWIVSDAGLGSEEVIVWGGEYDDIAVGVLGQADANLIAAAPTLYQALDALLERCLLADADGDLPAVIDGSYLDDARQALAKARGESL